MHTDNCTCTNDFFINIPAADQPRLVIIGGGFAGLYLAKHLKKANLQIVLLDRNNFHAFQPLLYQVATAMLEPEAVASSFRKIFKEQKNFHFRMVGVRRIDPINKIVTTDAGCLAYDILVIATGVRTNFYGMEDVARHAFTMKNVPDAIAIRQRIFGNFEKALMTEDENERDALMNIVIVGGGPTGIEIAGAIGELKKFILPYDYRELDLHRMRIHLVEATNRLLTGMSDKAADLARKGLEKFSVNLLLNTKITAYNGKVVITEDGRKLQTRMLIWVAGMTADIPPGLDRIETVGEGRIRVDLYNSVAGYDDIYALGDVASVVTENTPRGHAMLAPVAIQQAKNLAENISLRIEGKGEGMKPFRYHNRGIMATIGRNQAIVEAPGFSFGGLPAWLAWLFVHLLTLVGFRNKVIAFINWAWNYLSYDRGMRLIIRPRKNT